MDKTTREKVKDPDRIKKMGYVEKLRRSTANIGASFIDYLHETGTCVFQVGVVCSHGDKMVIVWNICRLNTSQSTSWLPMTMTLKGRSKELKGVW